MHYYHHHHHHNVFRSNYMPVYTEPVIVPTGNNVVFNPYNNYYNPFHHHHPGHSLQRPGPYRGRFEQ